jgi:hypothetical protein
MELKLDLGNDCWGHASGALFHAPSATLLIADAHLGYGWAQRRRGQLGPVTDGGIVDRLFATVSSLAPREVLFLGDTVHAPRPLPAEREFIEGVLLRLIALAKVSVVQGNHDRAFTRDFGHLPILVSPQWRCNHLLGVHGDRLHIELPEADYYLIGHLHPAITVRDDAGANKRIPAFLVGQRAILLPAFSPFAAGFDVSRTPLPKEVADLLGESEIYPVTGKRIVRLPRHLAAQV